MKNIILIATVLFFFIGQEIFSQEKWTLEQCIQYAITNNLNVKQSNIQNEINKENLDQSKRDLLPYASFNTGASNSFGRSLDYKTYEYVNTTLLYGNYSISSGIDIFRGFTKRNTITFHKMNYLAGVEDEKLQEISVAFSVMEAYINTLYYNGLIEIVTEQKELSELNLGQTRKMVDLGLKAKTDLLEMESRLAKEELSLIQTQNYYKTALLNLKQAMNFIEPDFAIDLSIPEEEMPIAEISNPSDIFGTAVNFYPTIKAGELRKDAAQKNLAIAKGNLWPQLTMSARYSSYYTHLKGEENFDSFRDQFKNNANQGVGLSLNIPVFERLGLRSDVKTARLKYLQAETEYQKRSQELYNEISQNNQELESLLAEYTQLVKQVEFAEIAYESAQKRLTQGLISIIELYDSKNIMAQAKSDLLRTKLQYIIKQKTIDFYLGKPVFGISAMN
jgi:outer membrane protein